MKNKASRFSKKTLVKAAFGVHARPAVRISQMAEKANAGVWLKCGELEADAASAVDILSLGAVKGTQIIVEIENQEDKKVLNNIVEFFEDGFGETI